MNQTERSRSTRCAVLTLILLVFAPLGANVAVGQDNGTESIVVTANRIPTAELDTVGNIARVDEDAIRLTNAVHPYEIGVQVPGVWISRGNGQEHLTAIRSPVLTGGGSCGAFLVLEDGIPTRPTGLCNVNQLFEVPTNLANSIEVIRGPANAVYGSNGLHGTINTILPTPGDNSGTTLSLETGSNNYWRGQALWDSGASDNAWNAGIALDSDGGYQDDTGYDQAKGFIKNQRVLDNGVLSFSASGSWLDQDSAGFITGFEAYKDDDRDRNENPGTFRDAYSIRLSAGWTPNPGPIWSLDHRFYMRNSEMEFLQFFLPGDPREENGQTSLGALFTGTRELWDDARLTVGIDAEYMDSWLEQFQKEPTSTGNQFVDLPRPQGQQYDYDADSYSVAAFANVTIPFAERWELQAGLRGEYLTYDYENNILSGNTTDDGSPCLLPNPPGAPIEPTPPDGGCLYNRPDDRSDSFFNAAPNLGLLYRFNETTVSFTNLARGFRVPQAQELYRLQAQQSISDIDSETLDSIETGIRHETERLSLETVIYYMKKDNFIFRDAEGINVSDGETKHYGIEGNLYMRLLDAWYVSANGSWAKQKYDFTRDAGLGEVIQSGNEIDTAPQVLASARLGWEYGLGLAELEWVYNDEYFLDAANTDKYEGHRLYNLRVTLDATENWSFAVRVNNLTDEEYADRADLFSITNEYRYFPGREREVYAQVTWRN